MLYVLMTVVAVFWGPSAHAGDLDTTDLHDQTLHALYAGPLDDAKAKQDEKAAEKDSAAEARMKKLEEARKGKNPRVVVLQWKGTDVDFSNAALQRAAITRIARPDAEFFPSIDIYQVGRREPRQDIRPLDERGSVPDDMIAIAMNAVHDIETVPWNAMSESDWGVTANQLRSMAEQQIWFLDRPELRGPLFHLYVQIGRAAENQNNSVPPFYETVGGQAVNYYWYLAGAMASEEASLLSEVTNPDMHASIDYYREMVESGRVKPLRLSFSSADLFDPEKFLGEYQVFVNGIERTISDEDGFVDVPPGRIDIYMGRVAGGHSLSDRMQVTKLEDKIYFVRDVARKRMGLDLIDQLMEHPNECTPELDGNTIHYITIYAKLHPKGEIYIAVPEAGNPNKLLLWRYDRNTGTLQKVLDDVGSYPIHFTGMGGIGAAFSGASYSLIETSTEEEPTPEVKDVYVECLAEPGAVPADCLEASGLELTPTLKAQGVPLYAQVRMNYGRFLFLSGFETSPALDDPDLDESSEWQEQYQLQNNDDAFDGNGAPSQKELIFNRNLYFGVGGILMKDAVLGIGPRGYMRVGFMNAPHVIDISAHGGITAEPPGMEQEGRRRLVVDVDVFAGTQVPYGRTNVESAGILFGISAGGGLVF